MSIDELKLNSEEPRSMAWKHPHLIDMDVFTDDRFNCSPERYPWTKIMYSEGIRNQQFLKAVERVANDDWDEVLQFKPIVIDENGLVISGFSVLQIFKQAGLTLVPVYQMDYLEDWEKMEWMMADGNNFQQYNWTPKLPRLCHPKVENYKDN